MFKLKYLALSILLSCSTTIFAKCPDDLKGEVNVISNSYPSLEVISKEVSKCQNNDFKVSWKLTREAEVETLQALSAKTSPYDIAQVANASIGTLQAQGLIQPINDLVEKYKDEYQISDSMLIKFGDDIVAVAFQVNAQNLFYRKDLFEKYNLAVPTTYEELLAAAEVLKQEPSIEFPLGGTYKSGWNLAQEFINLYLASGGEIFKADGALPDFNNPNGVATLELMKRQLDYMSPNALALDITAVLQQFQQGKIAMGNFWASRADKMDDPNESTVVGKIGFAATPSVIEGGPPATTLWWDGFVLPKNMDGDRETAFKLIMSALNEDMIKQNNGVAIWLHPAYEPTEYAQGVADAAAKGAASFPILAQMTIAHAAIGNHIGDFLAGNKSAEKALADAESQYIQSAKEAGYIK